MIAQLQPTVVQMPKKIDAKILVKLLEKKILDKKSVIILGVLIEYGSFKEINAILEDEDQQEEFTEKYKIERKDIIDCINYLQKKDIIHVTYKQLDILELEKI